MKKNNFLIFLRHLLPLNIISNLINRLAYSKNKIIKNNLIKFAIKIFNINLNEAKKTDINKYISFNDFFIRELKYNSRPILKNNNIISSPADGILTQFGRINNDSLLQTKNKLFSLKSLINSTSKTNFNQFATIYLSPRDYHRVHMPIDGQLTKMIYIPGKLFSVNKMLTKRINNIFIKNERLICYFNTSIGELAIIFIGAFLVSGIETIWHGKIIHNYYKKMKIWNYDHYIKFNSKFNKGDVIGWFNFGSTVIILIPGNNIKFKFNENINNINIKVNQDLALIIE